MVNVALNASQSQRVYHVHFSSIPNDMAAYANCGAGDGTLVDDPSASSSGDGNCTALALVEEPKKAESPIEARVRL